LIPAGTGSKEYKNLSPQTVATNTQNIWHNLLKMLK
jgi:hypothetical protein